MKNIFEQTITDEVISRINSLNADSQPQWGKMSVAQMLAHCCVSYEMVYEDKHKKPNPFMRLILKSFVKKAVVNEIPYKPGSPTAPAFVIKGDKDFEAEKKRLTNYIIRAQQSGEAYFDNKESLSFGPLTKTEWNNLFYKHLDHHLRQFNV
ncbi:hypothetical protein D770_05930 [Flammeovirgaceae bacterium 311]|nr:hypothetical protein D770_05930 [Flammeovirgaceae bacterium 311]